VSILLETIMRTLLASTTPPQIRATITTTPERLGWLLKALADFDKGSMRLVVEIVGERGDAGNTLPESFPPARPVNGGNAPSAPQREKMAAVLNDCESRYPFPEDFSGECG
jgi:hypothetical protein